MLNSNQELIITNVTYIPVQNTNFVRILELSLYILNRGFSFKLESLIIVVALVGLYFTTIAVREINPIKTYRSNYDFTLALFKHWSNA